MLLSLLECPEDVGCRLCFSNVCEYHCVVHLCCKLEVQREVLFTSVISARIHRCHGLIGMQYLQSAAAASSTRDLHNRGGSMPLYAAYKQAPVPLSTPRPHKQVQAYLN